MSSCSHAAAACVHPVQLRKQLRHCPVPCYMHGNFTCTRTCAVIIEPERRVARPVVVLRCSEPLSISSAAAKVWPSILRTYLCP